MVDSAKAPYESAALLYSSHIWGQANDDPLMKSEIEGEYKIKGSLGVLFTVTSAPAENIRIKNFATFKTNTNLALNTIVLVLFMETSGLPKGTRTYLDAQIDMAESSL